MAQKLPKLKVEIPLNCLPVFGAVDPVKVCWLSAAVLPAGHVLVAGEVAAVVGATDQGILAVVDRVAVT